MPFNLDDKLVIAVTSSALFDMSEEDEVFRSQGVLAYKLTQRGRIFEILGCGTAYHFLERLLRMNSIGKGQLVEIILLSRNDPYSGYRVMNSIEQYGLDISRAIFLGGRSPLDFISPLKVDLFLSANKLDVRQAILAGYPAGLALPGRDIIPFDDEELRIAFDFDGVIADDEAESIYQKSGRLSDFHKYETEMSTISHHQGPLGGFFRAISAIRDIEVELENSVPSYRRKIRISIITARNAPSHHRVFTTLSDWGIEIDDIMFLGGISKSQILNIIKPHVFFDDQMTHLQDPSNHLPSIHIPFGITNSI